MIVMAEHRRYRDEEVREIFDLAVRGKTAGSPAPVHDVDGLTLGEIQSIGAEVGLAPDAVAHAAAALDDRASRQPRRTSFGMPISASRVVPPSRPLTDDEWTRLVADLRMTFNARGTAREQAGIREWSNGNLHACIEPAGQGYRLRMSTVKGDAAGFNALGLTGLAAAAATFGSLSLSGELADAVIVSAIFAVSGIGALIANRVRLPRWAKERETQMESIARRLDEITSAPSP